MKYLPLTIICVCTSLAHAQHTPAQATEPFKTGDSLGVTADGAHEPMSDNVTVYGAIVAAESCVYDSTRGLIVVVNRGAGQSAQPNDAWVSLLNPDGSVHTPYWIGNWGSRGRDNTDPPLSLNDPLGSEIADGVLYIADRDGGTTPDASTWRVLKVHPDGSHEVLIEGAPLNRPNGIGFDTEGNLVVVNYGDTAVLTFTTAGKLIRTEYAAQPGGDGLVILPDGTKYVCSVTQGGVSRILPGQEAELIATGIPGAASMCYDSVRRQLVIPMTSQNGVAFLRLGQ